MANFETFHTMTDYYDGPRGGIADYRGVPHVYESTYADVGGIADYPGAPVVYEHTDHDVGDAPDNTVDVFRLSPITPEVFQLALEKWAIWLRWETAHRRGEAAAIGTHPALPHDQPRNTELERLLMGRLVIDKDCYVLVHGEFRVRNDSHHSGSGPRPLEVAWTPVLPADVRESAK